MIYLRALLQITFLFLSNVVLDVVGAFILPVAMLWRKKGVSGSDGREIIVLPDWAWLWSNDYDGLLGDKRNWWADNCDSICSLGLFPLIRKRFPSFPVLKNTSFYAMYYWAAFRNPANNMRFVKLWQAPITGSNITFKGQYTVEDKPGMGGWQFVITENGGRKWYGFYWVHEWSVSRAFVVRLGFKVKPSHAGTVEETKGMTTKINFYKAI